MQDTNEEAVKTIKEYGNDCEGIKKVEKKNILILGMSTVNNKNISHYYAKKQEQPGTNNKASDIYYRFEGISQLEPGTKFFLNSLAAKGETFDKIIVTCSPEARNENNETKYKCIIENEYNEPSAYAFYIRRIKDYIMEAEKNDIKSYDEISDEDKKKIDTSIMEFFSHHQGKRDISYDTLQKYARVISDKYIEEYTRDFNVSDDYKKIEEQLLDEAENSDISICGELYERQNIEGYIENKKTEMTVDKYNYVIDSFMLRDKWLRYFYEKLEWRLKLKSEYIEGLKGKIEGLEKQLSFLKNNMKYVISEYINLKSYQIALEENALKGETVLREENLKQLYEGVNIENDLIEKIDLSGKEDEDIKNLREAIIEIGEDINVYMDMQGGARTFASMMNGIVTLLENKKVTFKNKISIAFDGKKIAHEIIDETKSYRIYDLISAMKSFINYGKAELLVGFFADGLNRSEDRILKIIQNISDAIQICDPGRFDESILLLRKALVENKIDVEDEEIPVEIENNYFDFVLGDIKKEYENLLNNPSVLNKIEWCYKKGFTQQALTYIEDKIPEFLINENIISIEAANTDDSILDDSDIRSLIGFCRAPEFERKERIKFYYLPKTFNSDFFDLDSWFFRHGDLYARWESIPQNLQNDIIAAYREGRGLATALIKHIYGDNPLKNIIPESFPQTEKNRACNIQQWSKGMLDFLLVDVIMNYENYGHNADDKTAFVLAYYELRFNSSDVFQYQNMSLPLEDIINLYTQNENVEELYELNKKLLRILLLASPVMDNFSQYRISETELEENLDEQGLKLNARQGLDEQLNTGKDNEFAQKYITFRLGKKEDIENYILRYASFPEERAVEVECHNERLSDWHKFKIGVDVKDKENFRFLLKLHMALKKERNNSNHALEGEDRLPLTMVNRAIKIYLAICKGLFAKD
jgi:hypothetical protein